MNKFMKEQRKKLGNFEVIDFVDEGQIAKLRDHLQIDAPTSIRWNDWDYGSGVSELRALYEKGIRHGPNTGT